MRLGSTAILLLLSALACAPSAARAGEGASEYSHLGVQLRVLAAPALLHGSQEIGSQDTTIDGVGTLLGFALGSMLVDQLAFQMDLVLGYAPAADHGVLEDTVFTTLHLGAGLTYWFMPANLYLAASLGAVRSNVEGSAIRVGIEVPDNDPTDVGFGGHLAFGKQFWVTRRIGLGASLSLLASFADNPIGGEDTSRIVLAAAAGLSFTLN